MTLQKQLAQLKKASIDEDEDKQCRILENLEDSYHVDLTTFYGEDYNDKKVMKKLVKKIRSKL